jgi:hypothetical protein
MQARACNAESTARQTNLQHLHAMHQALHVQLEVSDNTPLLQVAVTEQQLAQERQAVQRLDGTAAQLQQDIDSQQKQLEEQGQCCIRQPEDYLTLISCR